MLGVGVCEPAGWQPLAIEELGVPGVAGQCPGDEQQLGPVRAQVPRDGAVLAGAAQVHRRGLGHARGGDAGPVPGQDPLGVAPNPLSIFTTLTFDAQEFSIPSSAAMPLNDAP
jgi:hypothetical protein